jgi:hypothetical protein
MINNVRQSNQIQLWPVSRIKQDDFALPKGLTVSVLVMMWSTSLSRFATQRCRTGSRSRLET